MTTQEAKIKIFNFIIHAEIGTYTCLYAPAKAVITISNLLDQIEGLTKYRAYKALHELKDEGMIMYTSQGNPDVISYGETPELVCEAAPPTNGYALTIFAFNTEEWKRAYDDWNESLKEWAEK